jgi:hypothetical protein
MPVIPVNRVVDPNRIIGKNGGPRRRRRGTKGAWPQKGLSGDICSVYWKKLKTVF